MKKLAAIASLLMFSMGLSSAMELVHVQDDLHKSNAYIKSIVQKSGVDDDELKFASELIDKIFFGAPHEQAAAFGEIDILQRSEDKNTAASLLLAHFARAIKCPYIEFEFRKEIASICIPNGAVEYFELCRHMYMAASDDSIDAPTLFKRFIEADDLLRGAAQCGDEVAKYICGVNLVDFAKAIATKSIANVSNMSGYLAAYLFVVKHLRHPFFPLGANQYCDFSTLICALFNSGNLASCDSYASEVNNLLQNMVGGNCFSQEAFGHIRSGLSHIFKNEHCSFLEADNENDIQAKIEGKQWIYDKYFMDLSDSLTPIEGLARSVLVKPSFVKFYPFYSYSNDYFGNELLECLSCLNAPYIGDDINSSSIHFKKNSVCTLLHIAARFADTNMVKRLIRSGANALLKSTYFGFTPLHFVVTGKFRSSFFLDEAKKIIRILSVKGLLNERDANGMSAFDWVCKLGRRELMQLLLDLAADAVIDNNNSELVSLWLNGTFEDNLVEKVLNRNRKFISHNNGTIDVIHLKRKLVFKDDGSVTETLSYCD
ncbi:hypothetical protein FACS1894122_05930 [Alphaproteobacteria bacterium]|nr:hypothetical protein FACS1894122_05930 [Alphaproteobacteria bacterium]